MQQVDVAEEQKVAWDDGIIQTLTGPADSAATRLHLKSACRYFFYHFILIH
jgi:hypothetical protein